MTTRKKIGEMLVEAGVLTEQGLRMALVEQRKWGGALGRMLVEMRLVSEHTLVEALARQLNLPTIALDDLEIHPTVLALVPGELAEQHNLIPFAQPMKFLDVAMADPTNLGLIDELRIRTQLNIRPYLAGPRMIERAVGRHYGRGFSRANYRRDVAMPLDGPDVITPRPTPAPPPPPPLPRVMTPVSIGVSVDGLQPFPRGQHAQPPDGGPPVLAARDAEIDALQGRISALEALVARDEEILRKLLALLVEKGVATREEILERIR